MGPDGVGPRDGWSEAELLGEGFAANLTTLRALQQRCGFTNEQAAVACGVAVRTYRRWRSQGNPPAGAVRLLSMLAGFVPWVGWEAWEVHGGYLFPPGFSRHGLSPADFQALVFGRQMVSAQQAKIASLTARIAELEGQAQQSPTATVTGLRRVQAVGQAPRGYAAPLSSTSMGCAERGTDFAGLSSLSSA